MRRLTLHAAIIGLLLTPLPALAQGASGLSGFYFGVSGGASVFFDQDFEADGANFDLEYDQPGYVIAGHAGYRLATNIRVETGISYAFTDAEVSASVLGIDVAENDFDISIINASAGLFLDLWPIAALVPYVGGGLGYSWVEVDIDGDLDAKDQGAFSLYGEVGVPYQLTPELSIVPSARFNWIMTEEEIGGGDLFADDLYTTDFKLGLQYAL